MYKRIFKEGKYNQLNLNSANNRKFEARFFDIQGHEDGIEDDEWKWYFYDSFKKFSPYFYHESLIENYASILKNGLTDEGNFAAVAQLSDFVTSKHKVIVEFKLRNYTSTVMPDMQYVGDNAFQNFFTQNDDMYVSINRPITFKDITSIIKI